MTHLTAAARASGLGSLGARQRCHLKAAAALGMRHASVAKDGRFPCRATVGDHMARQRDLDYDFSRLYIEKNIVW